MSGCESYLGRPYQLGACGSAGEIDCIHLCYGVLEELGIPAPDFDWSWYEASPRIVMRAIQGWGKRIADPAYDGDISLVPSEAQRWAFAVTWQNGILHINQATQAVHWLPRHLVPVKRSYRYCPLSRI